METSKSDLFWLEAFFKVELSEIRRKGRALYLSEAELSLTVASLGQYFTFFTQQGKMASSSKARLDLVVEQIIL